MCKDFGRKVWKWRWFLTDVGCFEMKNAASANQSGLSTNQMFDGFSRYFFHIDHRCNHRGQVNWLTLLGRWTCPYDSLKKRIYGSEYLLYFLPPFGFISGGIGTGTFVEIIVLVGIYGIRCQSVKVKVSNSLWHFIREGWLLTVSLKEGLFSWKL